LEIISLIVLHSYRAWAPMEARLGVREPTSSLGEKAEMYKNTKHKTRGDRET